MNLLKENPTLQGAGVTVVRVVVGLVFFVHGWQKLFEMGIGGVGGFFESLGIPAAGIMAIVVTLLELLGGLALILGVGTRIVAALLAVDMTVALLTVHLPNGFGVGNGGYEFVLVLLAASLGLVLAGAGSFSIDQRLAAISEPAPTGSVIAR